jgi:hypothetical protein
MNEGPHDGVSRRDFGRLLGAAALSGMLPNAGGGASREPAANRDVASTDTSDEICDLTAVELAARIRRKQVSAREVMTAHLERIERTNGKVNAIVTLVADRAMADARRADEHQVRGVTLGPLHGCRWRTRTSSTRRGSAPPSDRPCGVTTCRPPTR